MSYTYTTHTKAAIVDIISPPAVLDAISKRATTRTALKICNSAASFSNQFQRQVSKAHARARKRPERLADAVFSADQSHAEESLVHGLRNVFHIRRFFPIRA